MIDESHVSVPQVGAMYKGDRSRKETLVEYGFRLPSALDNRPMRFRRMGRRQPADDFRLGDAGQLRSRARRARGRQVVRPTGLVDPQIEMRPALTQVDDLLSEISKRVAVDERVLVTTLTKRMAEDLTDYLADHGVRVRYLHSDIDTVERVEIIRDLRLGTFDVLVGINLLREGLDMPEVSLVAILDADKEGFLRSERSLIQTIGRAARNLNGRARPPHRRNSRAADLDEEPRSRRAKTGRNRPVPPRRQVGGHRGHGGHVDGTPPGKNRAKAHRSCTRRWIPGTSSCSVSGKFERRAVGPPRPRSRR